MPTGPVILVHSVDPKTGLTRCGNRWPGDVYQAQHWRRVQCAGCRMALEAELFSTKKGCGCKPPVLCRSEVPRG